MKQSKRKPLRTSAALGISSSGGFQTPGTASEGQSRSRNKLFATGAVVLAITLLVYLPSLSNQFTNWDDGDYLRDNPLVKSLSSENIRRIFSTFVMGNYHPLTVLSYAAEYHFAKLDPGTYHATNLCLHLANTFLVLLFVWRLTQGNLRAAAVAAALFALHPMHLESVAWVSERKDLLYTLFFLASLIAYLRYLDLGTVRAMFWSLGLFVLALCSKGQAVVLAPVLILIDYYRGRRLERKVVLEKVPFFVLALIFGLVALRAQKSIEAVNEISIPWQQSLFFGFYGLVLYCVKAVLPFSLSAFHPYPLDATGGVPIWIRLTPLLVAGGAFYVYKFHRRNRDLVFGLLFFGVTISVVLQFLPVGKAVIAERYTYVPYIGLFCIAGQMASGALKGLRTSLTLTRVIVAGLVIVYAAMSSMRIPVWRDSLTLWDDVLSKYPEAGVALRNHALANLDVGDVAAALNDSRKLTEINPKSAADWNLLGFVLMRDSKYDEAIEVFSKGIRLDPAFFRLYGNRGMSYANRQKFSEAVADYSMVIKLKPADSQTYLNRGVVYTDNLGAFESGIRDFRKVLELEPGNVDARVNIGVALFKSGKAVEAVKEYTQVISSNPDNARAYYLRALANQDIRDNGRAYSDALEAKRLGFDVSQQVLDGLNATAAGK